MVNKKTKKITTKNMDTVCAWIYILNLKHGWTTWLQILYLIHCGCDLIFLLFINNLGHCLCIYTLIEITTRISWYTRTEFRWKIKKTYSKLAPKVSGGKMHKQSIFWLSLSGQNRICCTDFFEYFLKIFHFDPRIKKKIIFPS